MNRHEEYLNSQGRYIPENLSRLELGIKRAANLVVALGSAGLGAGLLFSNDALAGAGFVAGTVAYGVTSKIERVSVDRGSVTTAKSVV